MKDIYYKSSEGVILNLIGSDYTMLSETDLLNTEWQYETVGTNYPYISAFKNQMVSRTFTVVVSGTSNQDMLDNLEHLMETIDRDVRIGQMGKLYVGNFYRDGYFTATEKSKTEGRTKCPVGLTFVCEDGDWKSTQDQSYSGLSGGIYLNQYSVPSVSSNETDYSYGTNADTEGTLYVYEGEYITVNIGSADTFHIESLQSAIKYKLPSDNSYTTINPSDCPYDIDVSNIPYYVEYNTGYTTVLIPAFLMFTADISTNFSFTTDADNNKSTMDWQNAEDDTQPIVTFDLGSPITIKEISGLDIFKGYNATSNTEAYLQISVNGSEWTTVDTQSIPTDNSSVELSKTWSSNYPTVRYIRVSSSHISGSDYGEFAIRTKHFQVQAHLEGEEQNLATSVVVSFAPSSIQTYTITEEGNVELYRKFASSGYPIQMTFTLPETTTIVAINNLTIKNNDDETRTLYIKGDDQTLDTVTLSANSTTNYSWSGEAEVSVVALQLQSRNVELTSSNFELLEEQTQAPHRYILNENYVPSDAIIRIYGPTTSPSIMIGDNQYGAENITLDDGEYLEINTKDETIQHYVDSEGWVNVFNHRLDDTFEKIEVGTSEITWQGNLDIDIRLLNSRSDPKWN